MLREVRKIRSNMEFENKQRFRPRRRPPRGPGRPLSRSPHSPRAVRGSGWSESLIGAREPSSIPVEFAGCFRRSLRTSFKHAIFRQLSGIDADCRDPSLMVSAVLQQRKTGRVVPEEDEDCTKRDEIFESASRYLDVNCSTDFNTGVVN